MGTFWVLRAEMGVGVLPVLAGLVTLMCIPWLVCFGGFIGVASGFGLGGGDHAAGLSS